METKISVREEPEKSSLFITKAELSIVAYIIEGKTSKEIAEERGTTARTIDLQRRNLLQKLGCRNMPHLIHTLWKQKILPYHGDIPA